MSKSSKQQKLEKASERINKILFLPIACMLILVPLIVRMKVIVPNETVQNVFKKPQIVDFFAQGKAIGIMTICIIMSIMLFFLFDKTKIKKDKYIVFYSSCAGIFLFFSILSTIFSEYKDVALWGVPDRAEGLIIYLCYMFMMMYMIYSFNKPEHYKYIIIPLGIVTIILTIVGLFQWIGKDLMVNTEIGKNLIIPKKYAELKDSLATKLVGTTAYGTFSNPNYIGSFVALVFPVFITLGLLIKEWKKQIIYIILACCSIFLLAASGSRAGMMGCIAAVIGGVILLGRLAVRKWVITAPIILVGIAVLFSTNQITQGKLGQEIGKLVTDIVSVMAPIDQVQDYKDTLHVRQIISEDRQVIIKTQEETLTVTVVEGELRFYDGQGQEVKYKEREKDYITKDKRFTKIKFTKIFINDENKTVGGVTLRAGKDLALLRIDSVRGIYPIDSYTQERINIVEAPAIGFKGKEKMGSGRGYIWSRSIPILLDSLLIGKGSDAFPMYFPQNDYIAKAYVLKEAGIVVDKPHDMYLQIGINNSGVALVAFLALTIGYLIQSLCLYGWKKSYIYEEKIGIATVVGILGYLVAGVFNDSVVGIAFIAWILLGIGISVNYLITHQQKKEVSN